MFAISIQIHFKYSLQELNKILKCILNLIISDTVLLAIVIIAKVALLCLRISKS